MTRTLASNQGGLKRERSLRLALRNVPPKVAGMSSDLACFTTPLADPSPFYLGDGILERLPALLKAHDPDRCFLIASRPIMTLHGRALFQAARQAGIAIDPVGIGDSEQAKSWSSLRRLSERLVMAGATRDSLLLALGGGVTGNLVGLCAALLFRGVRFVEIPTTLMALTDSTLSNKQAINGSAGKNLFGTYRAPLFIWGDCAYLRTESERRLRGGVVEGIKNVFIHGTSADQAEPILAAWDARDLRELARVLIDSKRPILEQDPGERGRAVALEYGHTFGHAIEWLSRGQWFHGEAVAIGMCLAAQLSHALGYLSSDIVEDHFTLLGERLGVPTRLPESIAPADLLRGMKSDNKRSRQGLRYLLLAGYGQFVDPEGDLQIRVPDEQVLAILEPPRRREGAALGMGMTARGARGLS